MELAIQEEVAESYMKDLLQKLGESETKLDLPCLQQPAFETVDSQICIDGPESRVVIIDSLRPVKETLEQLFVKEFESAWVDDMQRYAQLSEEKPSEPEQKRSKTETPKEKPAEIEVVEEPKASVDESYSMLQDSQEMVEDEVIADSVEDVKEEVVPEAVGEEILESEEEKSPTKTVKDEMSI